MGQFSMTISAVAGSVLGDNQHGKYLSVPSEGDAIQVDCNRMIVPDKISASRLLKRVAAFSRDGMAALYGRGAHSRRSRRIGPDELALLAKTVRNYLVMEQPSITQVVEDVRDAFIAENLRRKELEEKEVRPSVSRLRSSTLSRWT